MQTLVPLDRRVLTFMPPSIQQVIDYIDAHLEESIRTTRLAAEVGLSVSHFTRFFKASTGSSPRLFVLTRRIEAACDAMLRTDQPLTTIAHACGFCDHAHLCRSFKQALGEAPHMWRRNNKMRTHPAEMPRANMAGQALFRDSREKDKQWKGGAMGPCSYKARARPITRWVRQANRNAGDGAHADSSSMASH